MTLSTFRLTALATSLALASSMALADDTNRLQQLEQRVNELEQHIANSAASSTSSGDTGVPLHGFLDVNWTHASSNAPSEPTNYAPKPGFRLGTLDLYFAPQISDRVRALIEMAFEYDENGVLGTDLERVQLGYTVSDALTVWTGRFHSPYGYWNTAYHHGAQIQLTATRPRFLGFEDQSGILPAHTVGMWATGSKSTDLGKLEYDVYGGNGDSIRDGILDYQAAGDFNRNTAAGFRVSLTPQTRPDLKVGLHGMTQKVDQMTGSMTTGSSQLQFFGGYTYFNNDTWEVLGEYYAFSREQLADHGHRSSAFYIQVGREICPQWVGFVRAERAILNQENPYFAALANGGTSYSQQIVGLHYELDQRSAIKFQIDHLNDSANLKGSVNTLRAQFAVRF